MAVPACAPLRSRGRPRLGTFGPSGGDQRLTLFRADRQGAQQLLRQVLDAVDRGDLTPDGPATAGLVRRLEGALLTLEALDKSRRPRRLNVGSWGR